MKKRFFQKQRFPQRCSYGNVYCLIEYPVEQIRKKSKTLRWMTRKVNQILFIFQIVIHPKILYLHVVRSVENTARESSPEGWKKSINFRRWWNYSFLQKKDLPSKYSYVHLECNSDKDLSDQKSNLFHSFCKIDKKLDCKAEKHPQFFPRYT